MIQNLASSEVSCRLFS